MRIIRKHRADYKEWWHDKVMICTNCDQAVMLQPGDQDHVNWWPVSEMDVVAIGCLHCRQPVRLRKEDCK